MKSRFSKYLFFKDYTPEELYAIFEKMCKEYKFYITDEAKEYVKDYFELTLSDVEEIKLILKEDI